MKNQIVVSYALTRLRFQSTVIDSSSSRPIKFQAIPLISSARNFFFIISLLLLLTACGGGGGGGANNNTELQMFQNSIIAYTAGDFTNAVTLFEQQLASYPNDTYSDESQYKLGRSYHALNNFTEARTAYGLVSTSGTWVDNAAFHTAKSYFDEGNSKLDPVVAFADFDTAISQLNTMIATYATSSLVDEAYYYLGRSYQDKASLKQDTPSLTALTEQQLFTAARTNYDTVQNTSVFYDNALYFKGRTYHEAIPAEYASARSIYQILITENTSSWTDDAKYQYGKTFYDEAIDEPTASTAMVGFNNANTEFDYIISSTDPLYQNGNRTDSARYYKGRSIHRQARLVEADPTLDVVNTFDQHFINARAVYQSVIDLFATGSYADNAQYQIGKTYYDESLIALNQTNYPAMQQSLSDAIAAFTVVTTNLLYQVSNSADNAYYYLGRSYHAAAEIPAGNRLSIGGVDFNTVTYTTARTQYEALTGTYGASSLFPSSNWVDNAHYEIGNTWYAEAQTAMDPLTSYNSALVSYNSVLSDYKAISIREDNSALQIGLIYHEAGYCTDEQAAYTYLVNNIASASTTSIDTANIHLADLSGAPTATHTCTQTPSGLQGFIQP